MSGKVRSNPSLKRSANGRPRLALISFWAKRVLPLSPA
jgi:hypothetical protein